MRIEGVKRLLNQLDNLPVTTRDALATSVARTAKLGYVKAKAVSPVVTGDLVSKYSWNMVKTGDRILGFINLHDGTREAAIKFGVVNYGRKIQRVGLGTRLKGSVSTRGITAGYGIRENVITMIGDRHKRAVSRQIKKAIKEALNG